MELVDRHAECGVLDQLIEAVRAGESRALVVSGEAGVGKTALLEYLAEQASGCRLARIAGVQSEMELPFAALHQLCAPVLGDLQRLPEPQRRGGAAAGAAFLERATMLTIDPMRRTERALAAASAKIKAGAFGAARDLLSVAEAGPLSDFQQARIEMMGAQLALLTNRGSEAPPLLLKAARRLEPVDLELSRATYLQALTAGYFAGRLALGGGVAEVARAAANAPPPPHPSRAPDLLLDGLIAHLPPTNHPSLDNSTSISTMSPISTMTRCTPSIAGSPPSRRRCADLPRWSPAGSNGRRYSTW
jgi:hypothetical protein